MSTPAIQTSPAVTASLRVPRTRLQPIGGTGKSVYVMLVCVSLSIVGAVASRSYSKGGIAYLSSNVKGANIQVDDGLAGAMNGSGHAEVGPLPYGTRSLRILHPDYQPVSTNISMGWLSGNNFSFQLTPIPLNLRVNTMAGADISLNGKSIGTANNEGVFTKPGVVPGDYDIRVTMAGYDPYVDNRHLSPPSVYIYAGLNISQEHIRQMQDEQRRAQENAVRVQQLLQSAQQQFNFRQYQAALASVDEALKLEPGNGVAQQLKTRVVQTINILK